MGGMIMLFYGWLFFFALCAVFWVIGKIMNY